MSFEDSMRAGSIMIEMYKRAIPMNDAQLDAAIVEAEAELAKTSTGYWHRRFLWWDFRGHESVQHQKWTDAHSREFYLKMARDDRRKGQAERALKLKRQEEMGEAFARGVSRGSAR